MDDTRATPSHDGRLGRRILLSEVCGELIPRCRGARTEDIIHTAELNTAALNIVFSALS